LTAGDISEREIEKRKPTRRNQDQPSERGNEETVKMALRRQRGIERGQRVPRTPIKVEIVGFASVNPTSRRRRVGGKRQRAEQAFMNGAG
jgi:hypothetical protein